MPLLRTALALVTVLFAAATPIHAQVATGGTVTTVTDGGVDYKVHTFTTSGTFEALVDIPSVEYLIVGGGAGGGVLTGFSGPVTGMNTITIGAGGAGVAAGTPSTAGGTAPNGEDSIAFSLTALGGGGGGFGNEGTASGASGGGSSFDTVSGGGTGTQGNDGGASIRSTFGGGGGANTRDVTVSGGGLGGGGDGARADKAGGTASTGGGGDEPASTTFGGSGSSGIVIVRYPLPVVSIGNDTIFNEADGTTDLTITLSQAVSVATTVDYEITGTADNGNDFTAITTPGTAIIPAGLSTIIVPLTLTDDVISEGDETIIVTLTWVDNGFVIAASPDNTATVTIADDDTAALSIADVSGSEEGGDITVTVTLDKAVSAAFTVQVQTADGTALGASDYTAIASETLSFVGTAGETRTFTVTPTSDVVLEGDETLTASLFDLSNAAVDITNNTATVTIADDDTAALSIAKNSDAGEPDTDGVLTVTMVGESSIDTILSYSIGGTAIAGSDYVALSGSVTILAGELEADINIEVLDDDVVEQSENIEITLTGVTSALPVTISGPSTAIVTITDNDSRPTVEISGAPESVFGGGSFDLTVTFSEDVTGFEVADLVLTNSTVTSVSGGAAVYRVTIGSSGNGEVTVIIPDNVTQSAIGGNGNLASNTVLVSDLTVQETQRQITEFLQERSNVLLTNQPKLRRFLTGQGVSSFTLNAQGTSRNLSFYSFSDERNVWTEFTASRTFSDSSKGTYAFGAIGTHKEVNPNLLVGGLFEIDHFESEDGDSSTQGTGWLAGPYIVGKFANQPLFYEGRLLYGQTYSEIAPFGTYTDDFKTERWLVQFELSGEIELERLILWPLIDVSYTTDKQLGYTDSLNNRISSQSDGLGQLTLGMDFAFPIDVSRGDLELIGGISGIWTHTGASGSAADVVTPFDGTRGRIELGANYTAHNTAYSKFFRSTMD